MFLARGMWMRKLGLGVGVSEKLTVAGGTRVFSMNCEEKGIRSGYYKS